MRTYEATFIVRPDAAEEEIDAFVEQLKQVIAGGGATLEKVDKWGMRRLAYRVAKREEGFYVLMELTADAPVIHEIERRFRVSDLVIKFLTVRVDVKRKKIEKRRKEREKRAKRKPAAAAASTPGTSPGRPTVEQQMLQAAVPGEPVPERE